MRCSVGRLVCPRRQLFDGKEAPSNLTGLSSMGSQSQASIAKECLACLDLVSPLTRQGQANPPNPLHCRRRTTQCVDRFVFKLLRSLRASYLGRERAWPLERRVEGAPPQQLGDDRDRQVCDFRRASSGAGARSNAWMQGLRTRSRHRRAHPRLFHTPTGQRPRRHTTRRPCKV